MEVNEATKTVRMPYIEVVYKSESNLLNIGKYIDSLTYRDFEKDQSDELELRLKDSDGLFLGSYYPKKGSKISAKIGYTGEALLNCGTFTLDEIGFEDSDEGRYFSLRALAASINDKLREQNTKYYEAKTLIQIAKEIGNKHGFTVGGSQGFLKIPRADQYKESDLAFLRRIAEEHGYIFKITDTVLTFTKTESLEEAKPLSVIKPKDLTRLNLQDKTAKTYNSCKIQYYNPKKGKYINVVVKGSKKDVKNEVMKLDVKCQTKEQAIAKAKTALRAGQSTVEGSFRLKEGNRYCIAGCNFTLTEYGYLNGTYHIKSSEHTITLDNYECNGEVEKIA